MTILKWTVVIQGESGEPDVWYKRYFFLDSARYDARRVAEKALDQGKRLKIKIMPWRTAKSLGIPSMSAELERRNSAQFDITEELD